MAQFRGRRALTIVVLIVVAGWLGWRLWIGPSPDAILASIDEPPTPVLTPDEEAATFRLAPGFRIELVAAEPLVVDPVAMDWDDEGRLYVVEMRGFMPDVDGNGEDQPVGRVVVLEDRDADGRMDESHVFLDGLVLPRAIAVLPEGVLIGEPPNLWLCADEDRDLRCDEKIRILEYAAGRGNVEHSENGLLPGLDGWLYNAKSSRRFRLAPGTQAIEVDETLFRGQWGIAQDDAGRLYYNHNSGFLYVDLFPGDYALRQPAIAARTPKPGLNVDLARGEDVHGIRVAPGLNRAYTEGALRRDGRQLAPTAVSGLAIQRGHQFGSDWIGDAFVPESAGSAVAHFQISAEGLSVRADHVLYPDPDYGRREFLASTDERFRPVDADFGPDGALWIIDMYRGVIQHAEYVSDHLRAYIARHDLAPPGATGRIWRIVREDAVIERRPPDLSSQAAALAGLDHANGWVRDHARRRLVHDSDDGTVPALRDLESFGPTGRREALWALSALDALDLATWLRAIREPATRGTALHAGRSFYTTLRSERSLDVVAELEGLLGDPDPTVRLAALHALGDLPADQRPLERLLDIGRGGDPLIAQAVLSGLAGLEMRALEYEIERAGDRPLFDPNRVWIEALSLAAHRAAQEAGDDPLRRGEVLALISSVESEPVRVALVQGVNAAQRLPGSQRIELPHMPSFFDEDPERDDRLRTALAILRPQITWPGDPTPGGARPLTAEEVARRSVGERLFAEACATCHGRDGRGLAGLAPPLAGSPWVRDADDWLVRIVLQGLTGPIRVDGQDWNGHMPGHADDPRFDDVALSGLLTHLRRSWGHAEDPVSPETISRIRRASAERRQPWTVDALLALPVEHRLDRYVGAYRVPVVGIEMVIQREGPELMVGRREGGVAPMVEYSDHLFGAEGMTLHFQLDEAGLVEGASILMGESTVPLTRIRGAHREER